MATIHITTFFLDNVNNVGWSENWWVNNTDPEAAALAWGTAYHANRKAVLLDTCSLLASRGCNVDHPRDSYVNTTGAGVGGISHAAQAPDAPWSALHWRRETATFNCFGHWYMRGIPSTIFTGRVYTPGSGYGVTFDANMLTLLTGILGTALLRKVVAGTPTYPALQYLQNPYRTERKPGRPFNVFRGRRAVA